MPIDVLCIGHAAYDLSVFVDAFPEENSKCETQELTESPGGPAANAAYLLSLWNARAAFAGLVGDDRYGLSIRNEFLAAGTDVSLLEIREGHPTPVSLIVINKQTGSRTIVNRKMPQAAVKLDPSALDALGQSNSVGSAVRTVPHSAGEMVRAADPTQILPDSPRVLLMDGHELEASLLALEKFPDAISILDAGSWREGTAKLAGRVDYLVASERFAKRGAGLTALNTEADQHACVRRLREQFSSKTVVTLGENGLIGDIGDGFFRLPAYPATAIDTTAAGDIFHGAFAYAILHGMPLTPALQLASMAASLSVRLPGGRTSIPELTQVMEALK